MEETKNFRRYPTALTIAGLDPSGGAGLLADIKTFSALGVYGMAVATALTEQNTLGVRAVNGVDAGIIYKQAVAVMSDIETDVVKIGMVHDAQAINAIAKALEEFRPKHVVVDPVMMSSSGEPLMQPSALRAFIDRLLPLATLITPNEAEYEYFLAMGLDADGMARNGTALLLTGGDMDGEEKTDILYTYNGKEVVRMGLVGRTINTRNTHGTGCTLSSAIAAYLAREMTLNDAVSEAKLYVSAALIEGADVKVGNGAGSLNHLFNPQPQIKL